MKATREQQQALLTLINRIYSEIRTIEETYAIYARPGDFRPRIEYFHDAVRTYTQNATDGFERTGRLSVESLALDVYMLRQITEKPLVRHPELAIPLSPSTALTVPPTTSSASSRTRIDIGISSTLTEGYGHYALLFVALLSQPAERNYMNRLNETTNHIEIMHDLMQELLPKAVEAQINEDAFLAGIADPELRTRLMAAIVTCKKHRRATNGEMLHVLEQANAAARNAITALEASHMRFASGQLVLYQHSQRIVKRMAEQGLNIVGEYVENAVREAQRDNGRGF